jgi:superfamily II DNA or RNA helicase
MKTIALRKHQVEACDTIFPCSKGIIVLPTGTGKNYIQVETVLRKIKEKQSRGEYGGIYTVCTPRILLTLQNLAIYAKYLSAHSIQAYYINVNSGEFPSAALEAEVAKCGLQAYEVISTTNFIEIKQKCQLAFAKGIPVVIGSTYHSAEQIQKAQVEVSCWLNDEAQYLVSNNFNEITLYNSKEMYFFTATPKVTDDEEGGKGMNNENSFGKVVFRKTPKEMIEAGEIVKPAIHLIGVKGSDCFTDLSYDYKSQWNAIQSAFFEHRKAIKAHSVCPDKIGAKIVIVCEGQRALKGILGDPKIHKGQVPELRKFREENPDVKIYALSTDFGIFINGKYKERVDNSGKERFLLEMQNLKPEEEAIIFHVDMIAEGIDVPGITGVMPFRNLGRIKILQNIGRSLRLTVEDREALYSGLIKPCDFHKYIKPYAWVILPVFMSNSNDSTCRIKDIVRTMRSEYGFKSDELVILDNRNTAEEFQDFEEVAQFNKEIRSINSELREFVHCLENEEELEIISDRFFKVNVLNEREKSIVVASVFGKQNIFAEKVLSPGNLLKVVEK